MARAPRALALAAAIAAASALVISTPVAASHPQTRPASAADVAFATTHQALLAYQLGVVDSNLVYCNVLPKTQGPWRLMAESINAPTPVGSTLSVFWEWSPKDSASYSSCPPL